MRLNKYHTKKKENEKINIYHLHGFRVLTNWI